MPTDGRDEWGGDHAPPERRLASALTRLDKERRTLEGAQGLGTADLRLLWLLADESPRTLRQISDELGLEQSTVNRQVNAALGARLLKRTRRMQGSAYEFTRTAHGAQTFDEVTSVSMGAYAAALHELGESDAQRLVFLLQRFLGHFRDAVASTTEKG
ncbi:MAG: MarR family transcriptional regulator [Dietzia sp.]